MGHTKEKCYKLHGYPQQQNQVLNTSNSRPHSYNNATKYPNYNRNYNFQRGSGPSQGYKFAKGKGVAANALGMDSDPLSVKSEGGEAHNDGQQMTLTKEQYGQIIHLIQQFGSNSLGNTLTTNAHDCGVANFAGIVACTTSIDFGKLSCGCYNSSSDLWIIDSGASDHMTFNKKFLSNIIHLPYPLLVRLPNGYHVKVTEISDVIITPKIILHNVFLIPSFKFNLMSVSSLVEQLKCIVSFSDSSCILQGPSQKSPLSLWRLVDCMMVSTISVQAASRKENSCSRTSNTSSLSSFFTV